MSGSLILPDPMLPPDFGPDDYCAACETSTSHERYEVDHTAPGYDPLVTAISKADDLDEEVALLADALWASEVSGHPRREIEQRYAAALRAATEQWQRVLALSSTFGDSDDPTS